MLWLPAVLWAAAQCRSVCEEGGACPSTAAGYVCTVVLPLLDLDRGTIALGLAVLVVAALFASSTRNDLGNMAHHRSAAKTKES